MFNFCPICEMPTYYIKTLPNEIEDIDCFRCGKYKLTFEARTNLIKLAIDNLILSNLSGWIRENQELIIDTKNLERLINLPTPTVSEKATKLLIYLSKISSCWTKFRSWIWSIRTNYKVQEE